MGSIHIANVAECSFFLPVIVPGKALQAIGAGNRKKFADLVSALNRNKGGAKITWLLAPAAYKRDDWETLKDPNAIPAPSALWGRWTEFLVGELNPGDPALTELVKSLAPYGARLEAIRLVVWEYGVVCLDVRVSVAVRPIENLRGARAAADVGTSALIKSDADALKLIQGTVDTLYRLAAARGLNREDYWSLLGAAPGIARRMPAYGTNVLISKAAGQEDKSGIRRFELREMARQVTGAGSSIRGRHQSEDVVHSAGYDGQLALAHNEISHRRTVANWRLVVIYYSLLTLAASEVNKFLHAEYDKKLSTKDLKRLVSKLHDAHAFLRMLVEEARPIAMCDDDLDRQIYDATWEAWEGNELATRVVDSLAALAQFVESRAAQLRRANVRQFENISVIVMLSTGWVAIRDIVDRLTEARVFEAEYADPLLMLTLGLMILAAAAFMYSSRRA